MIRIRRAVAEPEHDDEVDHADEEYETARLDRAHQEPIDAQHDAFGCRERKGKRYEECAEHNRHAERVGPADELVRQPDDEAERTGDDDTPAGPLQPGAIKRARATTAMDVPDDREEREQRDFTGNKRNRWRFARGNDGGRRNGNNRADHQHDPREPGDERAGW